MWFTELLSRLENFTIPCNLQDCDVTANKIKGISFLLIKDVNGTVVECIILSDERNHEKRGVSGD